MCGRYRLSRRKQLVEEYFDASGEEDWSPRYNIAPTQPIAVVRQPDNSARGLSLLRWGLIPAWASDPGFGLKTINARSETVTTTASFSQPVRSQRCLIPADGFYEWKRTGKAKQPYCFEVGEGAIFAFAGLWDRWIDPQGEGRRDLHDPDDYSEHPAFGHPRPNARDPESRRLRYLAYVGQYGRRIEAPSTLRGSHASVPHKQPRESRPE